MRRWLCLYCRNRWTGRDVCPECGATNDLLIYEEEN